MHVMKIIVLLALTLAAMRLVSWGLLWLVRRASGNESRLLRLASNALALVAFAALLVLDSVPGSLVDFTALAFGGVVFCLYCAFDLRWLPAMLGGRADTPSEVARTD